VVGKNQDYYILEMNTRLQVEHPVTEMITGLDLVEWQLRVASGEPLPLAQPAILRRGHAVEARLYAEDPDRGFLPSTGRLRRLRFPSTDEHLRVDSGVREGDEVTVHYDPMLAKIVAWAPDRGAAIDRLRDALEATEVEGVRTNARFLWEILDASAVRAGDVGTRLLEKELQPTGAVPAHESNEAWLIAAAATPWGPGAGFRLNATPVIRLPLRLGEERHWLHVSPSRDALEVGIGGRTHRVEITARSGDRLSGRIDGQPFAARVAAGEAGFSVRRNCLHFEFATDTGAEHHASAEHEGHFRAPMPGHVLDVRIRPGDSVAAGTVLVVLEAMKMEHSLAAPWDGTVKAVAVKPGDRVEEGVDLVLLEPLEESSLRQAAALD
jgi:3-methylcrotonyl-CoA carboxylase alpha subunit